MSKQQHQTTERKRRRSTTTTPPPPTTPQSLKSSSSVSEQKSRYNDEELREFDQLIDSKIVIVKEQISFYSNRLIELGEDDSNKIKNLEEGVISAEREEATTLLGRQMKFLEQLENAKHRIKNKVYGICRETGKLISKDRLRAVPHATLSIEAKMSQDDWNPKNERTGKRQYA